MQLQQREEQATKHHLQKSFCVEFEYGISGEGYLIYDHMVLQLQDCVDCCKVIQNMIFIHVWPLMWAWQTTARWVKCGKHEQKFWQKSTKNEGHKNRARKRLFGTYLRQLQPRDAQSMVFTPNNSGPFWMSSGDQEKTCHDIILGGQATQWKLAKKELSSKLLSKGIAARGEIKDIQIVATNNGVAIEETNQKKIEG